MSKLLNCLFKINSSSVENVFKFKSCSSSPKFYLKLYSREYSKKHSSHVPDPTIKCPEFGKSTKIIAGAFGIVIAARIVYEFWNFDSENLSKKIHFIDFYKQISIDKNLFGVKNFTLYRYRSFNFPGDIAKSGFFEDFRKFKFEPDDIVVASFPKSGTTWVQEIVYMLSHNCIKSDSSSEVLETRFPYLEYPYPGLEAISKLEGRRFIKTHLPLSLMPDSLLKSGAKVIYIIRNPRDVAVSYFNFLKFFKMVDFKGSLDDFVNIFLTDKVPYAPYFNHVESFSDAKDNENVLIVHYEDLKEDSLEVIARIARFLEIEVSSDQLNYVNASTSFSKMAKNPSVNYEHWKQLGLSNDDGSSFFRKGIVGDWKNCFSPENIASFEAWEMKNAKRKT